VHPSITGPHRARVFGLFSKSREQWGREHHHTILAAFTVTHDDDAPIEVDILDSQLETFQ